MVEHSQTMQVNDDIRQTICETILKLDFLKEEQF